MTEKNDKPHLLIIRLSGVGDVAMAVPVVGALRKYDPGLRITILTHASLRPLLRDVEGVEFIDADFEGRHKGAIGIYRLRTDIVATGITHVADLHDSPRTRVLRRMLSVAGMKIAVIDSASDRKRELTRKFRKVKRQLPTAVERCAASVRELGFRLADPLPAVNVPRDIPCEILAVTGPKSGKWVGIAPFARHNGRMYPINMTAELIGLLCKKHERVFVFGDGPYEKEFAEYMERLHPSAVSAVGKISLAGELDLISNLDAMISMDSPAMHVASLEGVPVVSIWGATHPYAGFYGFGQNPANAMQLEMRCRPCSIKGSKSCMHKDYRCLTGIAPKTIAAKVVAVTAKKIGNKKVRTVSDTSVRNSS